MVGILAALLAAAPLASAEGDDVAQGHEVSAGHGEHHSHRHFPGVFVGATSVDSETDFTVGVEYEYKFSEHWGAGAVWETTNEAHDGLGTTVYLASLFWHPSAMWRFGAGLGQEEVGGDATHHSHSETLVRVSAGYEFLVGGFGIQPAMAVDFIDEDTAFVFGIAFTKPF
jgi:hypothetical protein